LKCKHTKIDQARLQLNQIWDLSLMDFQLNIFLVNFLSLNFHFKFLKASFQKQITLLMNICCLIVNVLKLNIFLVISVLVVLFKQLIKDLI